MAKTFFALTILTALLWLAGPILEKIPLGNLPGDFRFMLGDVSFTLPLTSIAISAILFFVLYRIYLKFYDN
jgi:hypothetical protein